MPDVAERSTDIGIALSTAAVAALAQMSPTFLYISLDLLMPASVRESPRLQDVSVGGGSLSNFDHNDSLAS
jgi:hypothetical protein